MARYTITVTETREIDVVYEIEADNINQAWEKIHKGDTVRETPKPLSSIIINRDPHDVPKPS